MTTSITLKAMRYCCKTLQNRAAFDPKNPLGHKALMVIAPNLTKGT